MQERIDELLRTSIADQQLDKEETLQLRELANQLTKAPELKAFARNRAFQLVREGAVSNAICMRDVLWLEKVLKILDTHGVSKPPRPAVRFSPEQTAEA